MKEDRKLRRLCVWVSEGNFKQLTKLARNSNKSKVVRTLIARAYAEDYTTVETSRPKKT